MESPPSLKDPTLAPGRIRLIEQESSANLFSERGAEINNCSTYIGKGDIYFKNNHPKSVFAFIKESISEELKIATKILSLGGDHSISYPLIDAFSEKYKDLTIQQVKMTPQK